MTRWAAAFLIILFAEPASARTQTEAPPQLVEHARVRVTLIERKPVVGTLLEIRADALRLESDSLVQTIPRPEIRRVEMSRGMVSGSGKGLRVGAIVGGVCGIGFGLLEAGIYALETGKSQYVEAGVGFGLIGAVTGGGLGALIGSGFKNESWKRVNLP
jgi:hypothetical protein